MVLELKFDRKSLVQLALAVVSGNLIFICGMIAFLYYWERRGAYGPAARAFIERVLVQFHLGAENVVAAWYSSMLLLLVSLACLATYALDAHTAAAETAITGTVPVSNAGQTGTGPFLSLGWLVLAAAFAGLSLDEIGSLHERVGMVIALNRASLTPSSTQAVGWVSLLAVPIGLVALFMLAFGWIKMRRAPGAFALLAIGVFLYVCDPVLEMFEGALVRHGGGGLLLLERILEEGVAELGGTTCLLFGVLLYARRVAGDGPHRFTAPHPTWIAAGVAAFTAGPTLTSEFVNRLPAGDNGIPENWFPAAALFIVALGAYATQRSRATRLLALIASAYFGAGFFGYTAWFKAIGYRGVLVDTIATAITVTLVAHALSARHRASRTGHRAPNPSP